MTFVGVGLLITTVGCNRNEPNYEKAANDALDRANLTDVDADYSSADKVVHVKGTVPSESDRQRAGEVVEQAVNKGAQVANEVTVAGGATKLADDFDGAIEKNLDSKVDLDPGLKDQDITFDANNGVVTITGRVATAADKDRVESMAKAESGVKDVVDSLAVGPKP